MSANFTFVCSEATIETQTFIHKHTLLYTVTDTAIVTLFKHSISMPRKC